MATKFLPFSLNTPISFGEFRISFDCPAMQRVIVHLWLLFGGVVFVFVDCRGSGVGVDVDGVTASAEVATVGWFVGFANYCVAYLQALHVDLAMTELSRKLNKNNNNLRKQKAPKRSEDR